MKTLANGIAFICILVSPAMAQDTPIIVAAPSKTTAKSISDSNEIGSSYYNSVPKKSLRLKTQPIKSNVTKATISDDGQSQVGTDACGSACDCATDCRRARRCRLGGIGQTFFNRGCADDCDGCSTCCQPCRYTSLFGGWTVLEDLPDFLTIGNNVGFNDGFVLGMARGRYLCSNVRVEIEGSWRNNTVETAATTFGHINNYATMFNIYRDFGNGQLKPYVGGGIGFSLVKGDLTVLGTPYEIDDYAFAFQGIAGVSYQQSSRSDLFVEYRFYGNTPVDVLTLAGADVADFTYLSHNLVFGIRFNR